jgi:hypothetical protein
MRPPAVQLPDSARSKLQELQLARMAAEDAAAKACVKEQRLVC